MAFLTGWISNIIIFILFAVVLDMLIPNSSLRKYTKLVIGLLLIAVMVTPIVTIFKTDFETIIQSKLLASSLTDEKSVEVLLLSKKNDIEASQRAYILEQMAVQLKNEAEEELMNTYGYKIAQVEIVMMDRQSELKQENIKEINVLVEKNQKNSAKIIQKVKKVKINIKEKERVAKSVPVDGINALLSRIWGLNKEKISIQSEEGSLPK